MAQYCTGWFLLPLFFLTAFLLPWRAIESHSQPFTMHPQPHIIGFKSSQMLIAPKLRSCTLTCRIYWFLPSAEKINLKHSSKAAHLFISQTLLWRSSRSRVEHRLPNISFSICLSSRCVGV
jgi:hypothetical protein